MELSKQRFQEFGETLSQPPSRRGVWVVFTTRRFIVVLAIAVVAGGFWWWSTKVVVSPPEKDSALVDSYFGADVDGVVAQEIFQVRGRFWESRNVTVTMYVVSDKIAEAGGTVTCGTTSSRFYGPLGESLTFRMALVSRPHDGGSIVSVGCRGCMAGVGVRKLLEVSFQRIVSAIDSGYVPSDSEVVAYADGDRPFDLRHHMTVDQFVSENEGHFVLVTIRLE